LGGGEGNQGDNKREEIKIKKENRKEKKERYYCHFTFISIRRSCLANNSSK